MTGSGRLLANRNDNENVASKPLSPKQTNAQGAPRKGVGTARPQNFRSVDRELQPGRREALGTSRPHPFPGRALTKVSSL